MEVSPGKWNGHGDFFVVFVVALLSLVMYEIWRRRSGRESKIVQGGRVMLPTPCRALPDWLGMIAGHTLRLKETEIRTKLESWADRFKSDYELNIMGRRTIVIIDSAEMRRILALRPTIFLRGTGFNWGAVEMGFAPSLFFSEGKEWGRSRRVISPSLHRENVLAMIPAMRKIMTDLLAKWSEQADAGEVVNVKDDVGQLTYDVLARVGLGLVSKRIDAGKGEEIHRTIVGIRFLFRVLTNLNVQPLALPMALILQHVRGNGPSVSHVPRLGWMFIPFLLPWARRAKDLSAMIEDDAQDTVRRARAEIKAEQQGPLVEGASRPSSVVHPKRPQVGGVLKKIVSSGMGMSTSDRNRLSEQQVIMEIKGLLVAGTDTSAINLSWAFYFITKHPEVHARCRREALEVAPRTEGLVSTSEERSRLEYCTAVFKESLRMEPSGPIFFFTSAENYTTKTGVQTEEGTLFVMLIRHAALSEENFTRAKEFIPERWITAEREEALLGRQVAAAADGNRTVHHREEAFIPFGAGPRVCPGQEFAMTEAISFIAAACARFDFALAPDQDDPPQAVFHLTCVPEMVKLVLTKKSMGD